MERIAIIGLGLMGGSLGLALKAHLGDEVQVTGYNRSPNAMAEALRRGAIDTAAASPEEAIKDADAVVIATPILAIRDMMQRIAPHLASGALVTDVGSTKAQVVRWAGAILPPGVIFIGGHPMAGKETSGIAGAEAQMLVGATYCLTPTAGTPKEAVARLVRWVERIGAVPLIIDAGEHDHIVAGISHLPLLAAAALVSATVRDPQWEKLSRLAASGYRDTTRLASTHPAMSRDICLTNGEAILEWLDSYIARLQDYRRLVAQGSGELYDELVWVRQERGRWLEQRGG